LTWIENGLVQKLIDAHAAERREDGIYFAEPFRRFVSRKRGIIFREKTIEEWRLALGIFNPTLLNLTVKEAGATMILLEFARNNGSGNNNNNKKKKKKGGMGGSILPDGR
jgi:hypothetical protein